MLTYQSMMLARELRVTKGPFAASIDCQLSFHAVTSVFHHPYFTQSGIKTQERQWRISHSLLDTNVAPLDALLLLIDQAL